jgi:hypothetical protein
MLTSLFIGVSWELSTPGVKETPKHLTKSTQNMEYTVSVQSNKHRTEIFNEVDSFCLFKLILQRFRISKFKELVKGFIQVNIRAP